MTPTGPPRGPVTGAWLLCLAALAALAAGCGTSNPYALGSYERGQFWLEEEQYQQAADAFEVFVRQNPTDSLAARAQFEKALAYMEIAEFPLAAVEFQILTQDFPTSDLVEAARFHEGECYYFQVGRIERDVTPAYEARLHWLDFARTYPRSEFMPRVREYMQEIADLLVRKRLRAVQVYRQLDRWDAVALSLERILEEEPTSQLLDRVLWQRGQVAERQEEPETAVTMYRQLIDEHPDSEWRDDARERLEELSAVASGGS